MLRQPMYCNGEICMFGRDFFLFLSFSSSCEGRGVNVCLCVCHYQGVVFFGMSHAEGLIGWLVGWWDGLGWGIFKKRGGGVTLEIL